MDIEKLEKLQALKEKGVITKQEFEQQKAALMKAPDNKETSVSSSSNLPGFTKGYRWALKKMTKESATNQLAINGWVLAFFPLMVAVLGMLNTPNIINWIVAIGMYWFFCFDIVIIKYYKKEDWVKHPWGWLISMLFVCFIVIIVWLFAKKNHTEGTKEQKELYALQATVGLIVFIISLFAVILLW